MNIDDTKKTKKFKIGLSRAEREEMVPRRLNVFPIIDAKNDNQNAYLYVDNNGTPSKISILDIPGKTSVKTVKEIPTDMEVGEYIFLEIN